MGKNQILNVLIVILTLFFYSCSSTTKIENNRRTLYLSNKYVTPYLDSISVTRVTEFMTDNGFHSWYCQDDYERKPTFEFGYFTSNGVDIGFILYDGTNTGAFVVYYRNGLDHRWDWDSFSFLITPDGEGRYYDFSNVPRGESTSPKRIYDAYPRKNKR